MGRVVVVVTTALTLVACGGSDGSSGSIAGERALAHLDAMVSGNFDAVAADFNDEVRAALDADGLREAWTTFEAEFGVYVSHGAPTTDEVQGVVVVRVPLEMADRAGEFRISYDSSERIAGIFMLKEDVPPASS